MMEKTDDKNRSSIIRIASITALVGNLLLAALKIAAGLYAGSMAVLGDGIDSSMDVLIALMTLLVAGVIAKPADRNHPWGHGRAETVATALLAMILVFAGGQLIINSAQHLIAGTRTEAPAAAALIATIISIAGKIFLSWSQYWLGKKADSAMLRANAKNMAADVLTSVGVLVGLGCSMVFNIGAIDLIAAILVGLWVIKNAIGIFLETNIELMDGTEDGESYRLLFEAVHSVPEAGHPHRARMRRIAGFWDIDLDIEVDPTLTITQAHAIASKVESAVKGRIEHIFDIMVHVEPAGNKQTEVYGLTETSLQPTQEEGMEKKVLQVEGMSCEHCVKAVTSAISGIAGVADVSVDLKGGTATFSYDPTTTPLETITAAITEEGYTCS